jgi:ABC-type sugar transport system substrate-binding protein
MANKKLNLVVMLVLVMAMVLSACQPAAPTQPAAAPEQPTAAPAQPTDVPAQPAPAEEAVKIVYIPKNTGNPYFDSIIRGFEQACLEIGCEFTTTAPATAEATS